MEDKCYILWLSRIKKIGLKRKTLLLKYFQNGKNIYESSKVELINSKILVEKDIKIIQLNKKDDILNSYVEELKSFKISYTTINDDDYPHLLKKISTPPLVLYYIGTLPTMEEPLVSIIGTRRPSIYGKNVTTRIASDLAKSGVLVVSGMARGIDTLASLGAIEGNGKTIAVLGCGVDICYPPENREVMKKIVNNGCVISEFPPKTQPIPAYFPMRNRIISGLSQATIVIEASLRSGTLITVDHALEQGREVLAVPGNITSKQSEGTNGLIKDGATPVTSYKDIINILKIDNYNINIDNSSQNTKNENIKKDANTHIDTLTDDENEIYKLITDEATSFDYLMEESKLTVQNLQFVLIMLEIKGAIKKLPGQQFIRSFNGGNI